MTKIWRHFGEDHGLVEAGGSLDLDRRARLAGIEVALEGGAVDAPVVAMTLPQDSWRASLDPLDLEPTDDATYGCGRVDDDEASSRRER
jgi:hypothetical protein